MRYTREFATPYDVELVKQMITLRQRSDGFLFYTLQEILNDKIRRLVGKSRDEFWESRRKNQESLWEMFLDLEQHPGATQKPLGWYGTQEGREMREEWTEVVDGSQ
jgi:hypothetical protein